MEENGYDSMNSFRKRHEQWACIDTKKSIEVDVPYDWTTNSKSEKGFLTTPQNIVWLHTIFFRKILIFMYLMNVFFFVVPRVLIFVYDNYGSFSIYPTDIQVNFSNLKLKNKLWLDCSKYSFSPGLFSLPKKALSSLFTF